MAAGRYFAAALCGGLLSAAGDEAAARFRARQRARFAGSCGLFQLCDGRAALVEVYDATGASQLLLPETPWNPAPSPPPSSPPDPPAPPSDPPARLLAWLASAAARRS